MRNRLFVGALVFLAACAGSTATANAPTNLSNVVTDDLHVNVNGEGIQIVTFTNADGNRCTIAAESYQQMLAMDMECGYTERTSQ